jgi:hypothetical protein
MTTTISTGNPADGPPPNAVPVARVVAFFETLDAPSLTGLDAYYDAQARFKDPFNDVHGVAAIRQIFEHMFKTLATPRFVITGQVVQGQQCFLTWEFRFAFKDFQRCTVTTGMRRKNCMRNCHWWAASCAGSKNA